MINALLSKSGFLKTQRLMNLVKRPAF